MTENIQVHPGPLAAALLAMLANFIGDVLGPYLLPGVPLSNDPPRCPQ